MPDYIPPSDDAFNAWQAVFNTFLQANIVALGLSVTDPDVIAMGPTQANWTTSYAAHNNAQNAAQAARQTKDLNKADYIALIRRIVGRLQNNVAVSDAERASLGITVPDTTPTPVGVPTTRPVLTADTSQRLQITVGFADEGTPTSKAKPVGVMGCEVWVKLGGTPPTDLNVCQFLTLDTRTPHRTDFTGAEANQTAHFIGRWVNTRGEKGPLSETVSATVPG